MVSLVKVSNLAYFQNILRIKRYVGGGAFSISLNPSALLTDARPGV